MNRTVETYKAAVRKNFSFLKQTCRLDDLFTKGIRLVDDQGMLVPICELHADDEDMIGLLGRWRAENAFAYPTQFPVTQEGTRRWLRNLLLDKEDRILFLVLDRHGKPVGHLGYASAVNNRLRDGDRQRRAGRQGRLSGDHAPGDDGRDRLG